MTEEAGHLTGLEIAIIGMACRFPGARNVEEFWKNLQEGKETITFFSDEELQAAGVRADVLSQPNYVRAGGVLDDIEWFDAAFFGFNPREAEIMDPQHRLFLECAWEALEHAGYASATYDGSIGVYAGSGFNSYLVNNVITNRDLVAALGGLQAVIGNDNNFLATRVSYKLDLRGPGVTIQTACSTSLVAIHLACQSLLSGECDIALAGGVSIGASRGYFYQEGGILSPDGHCRAFDARAHGTVAGSGAGIVVLKRLEDALADGDFIHAIIKGSAMNNDGAAKVGYTAPSIRGQAQAIRAAMQTAEVEPETISCIEAHGTGTVMGDPIEIAALKQAFGTTVKQGYCSLGSVKTNIGHLDTAAGVAGLIKTILAMQHQSFFPSLHFDTPNPEIDFANSPFYVQTTLAQWKRGVTPRRAGVSSFGIGGTNAHVILEEAPPLEASPPARSHHLLLLSARTSTALEAMTERLATYLQLHPELPLADIAYTLQVGRQAFTHRRMLVCQNREEATRGLQTSEAPQVITYVQEQGEPPIVFLFPGQGVHDEYHNMLVNLYREEPTFREQVDLCAALLKPHLGSDLRDICSDRIAEAAQWVGQTWLAQPILFVFEYALAQLWLAWGVQPRAMIGHSLGEYVAACLAGVFSLEEALVLVAVRGRLTQQLPTGSMLSVALSAADIVPLLGASLSVAAINAPSLCVVSGPSAEVAALQTRLTAQGITCRPLQTTHAFHSAMVEPMLESFRAEVRKVRLKAPAIPYVSTVTGDWITAGEATDPDHWVRHVRQPVRFADGVQVLQKESERILLEVGPGQALSTLVRSGQKRPQQVLSSTRRPADTSSDQAFLLNTLGKLWLAGTPVRWNGVHAHEQLHRLPLPSYPFERQRYWIDPQPTALQSSLAQSSEKQTAEYTRPTMRSMAEGASQHTRSHLLSTYVAPTNEIEEVLVGIWQEFFGLEQIGINDDYLELGGHSLLATQIVARFRDTFQVELPLAEFFRRPTIAELAIIVEELLIEKVEALSEDEIQRLL